MTHAFVRTVWGVHDKDNKLGKSYARRTKIDNDIELTRLNPYSPQCKVYVFGEENFKRLSDMGFDCKMVDKRPVVWDMSKAQWRHKIEAWKYALDDYDEILFLDWDVVNCKAYPDNIWTELAKGPRGRATLYCYHRRQNGFRKDSSRKLSTAGFVYLRGKTAADEIIKIWHGLGEPLKEEVPLSKWIDDLDGGWQGVEHYRDTYEIPWHTWYSDYDKEYTKNVMIPNNVAFHLGMRVVGHLLGDKNPKEIKVRLDNFYSSTIRSYQDKVNR